MAGLSHYHFSHGAACCSARRSVTVHLFDDSHLGCLSHLDGLDGLSIGVFDGRGGGATASAELKVNLPRRREK